MKIRAIILSCAAVFALGIPGWAQESGLPPGHPPLGGETTGRETAGIALSIPHVFVEAKENGTRTVTRYTLMAVPETGEATGEPPREFIFGLPKGATGVLTVEPAGAPGPLPADKIRRLPELNAWAIDLPPWEDALQIKVESFTPKPLTETGFRQQFFYPVMEMTVLVEPMDLTIAGAGLHFADVIDAMNVSRWVSEPIRAGGVLDFHVHEHGEHTEEEARTRIEAQPNRMTIPRPLLALLFVVFLGLALVAGQIGRT